MAYKFCANLNFMFREAPLLTDRFSLAAKYGFKAIECGNPYEHSVSELIAVKEATGIEVILINTPTDVDRKQYGFAALATESNQDFLNGIMKSIEYANALNCSQIHIMSGIVNEPNLKNFESMVCNLKLAQPYLDKYNITGLIEPINSHSLPNYYLNNYDTALNILKEVNSNNLKLMLDIFHLQQIAGDLTFNIKRFLPYTGHIQIAQVPKRHEPDTFGEIDYKYIFQLLKEVNYSKYIGLEYIPEENTTKGLKWIEKFGFRLM
ncbi:hypothetical protein O3M35_002140 [Rhynocoris fuscipes]|uniref:Putative hydroxypyruvate isomerase n=1 Tax=Rhynocoris fuscipes TaxID=488301 RepID=A0AAW1CTP1_9HEMI